MGDQLSLEIVDSGSDAIRVVARGDMDMVSKDAIDDALSDVGVEWRYLVLDMRGVTFIDSTGLNMLLRLNSRCFAAGGALVVASPSEQVRRLLELTNSNGYLTITE